nr:MAG TPA: hypothetical protein [Caudoviricetes sp.]
MNILGFLIIAVLLFTIFLQCSPAKTLTYQNISLSQVDSLTSQFVEFPDPYVTWDTVKSLQSSIDTVLIMNDFIYNQDKLHFQFILYQFRDNNQLTIRKFK